MDNLYSNPDDLDSQPEYPMRTELTFANDYETSIMNQDVLDEDLLHPSSSIRKDSVYPSQSREPPYGTLFILWIFGLILWLYDLIRLIKLLTTLHIQPFSTIICYSTFSQIVVIYYLKLQWNVQPLILL